VASTSVQKIAPNAPSTGWSTLTSVAVAVGAVVVGMYMLDWHKHQCESCGHTWRHLGAFNLGEVAAHTCRKCGTVQWWKSGFQQIGGLKMSDGALWMKTKSPIVDLASLQELRELRYPALPSG
jgi:hypothetical protein